MTSRASLVLVASALMVATPAFGSYVLELDVGELTKRSDRVVRAHVVERESRWDEARERIHTYTTLELADSLKGEGEPTIVVRQLGGEVDGTGSFVGGDAHFEVGEEVVVFLRRNPAGESYFHVIGLAQGKFRVVRSGERSLAVRDLSELSLMRPLEGRFVPLPEAGAPESIALDELERAIDAAARDR